MRFRLTLCKKLLLLLFVCGAFYVQPAFAQSDVLSLKDIITGLQSTSSDLKFEEKVDYTIKRVQVLGVSFLLNTFNENILKEAGATAELLEIIRQESVRKTASLDDISKANNLHSLGVDSSNRGDLEKAVEYYLQAIALNPRLGYAYGGLGAVYYNQKDYEKSIEFYSKAIAAKPDLNLYFNRAVSYSAAKDFRKAIRDFSMVIELKPDYIKAFESRAQMYSYSGENEKAIADFSKIIELDSDNTKFYISRALAYQTNKDFAKALADYEKIIELEPKNTKAYMNRALLYGQIKEYDKAITDYEKILELEPENKSVLKNIEQAKMLKEKLENQ